MIMVPPEFCRWCGYRWEWIRSFGKLSEKEHRSYLCCINMKITDQSEAIAFLREIQPNADVEYENCVNPVLTKLAPSVIAAFYGGSNSVFEEIIQETPAIWDMVEDAADILGL